MTPAESLAKAIQKIGGYSATARLVGLKTAWAVQKWQRCPAERVCLLVAASDGEVTAHDLRPDLYPNGFEFPRAMLQAAGE